MIESIYTNCEVITRSAMFKGTVVVRDGIIAEIDDTPYAGPGAISLDGNMLLPGLVEMHTDNLEKNIQPRPGVIWPSIMAATIAHDAQIIGAGITTVLDAVAVGGLRESSLRATILDDSITAINRGNQLGLFKADHLIHLRCEIGDPRMKEMLLHQCHSPYCRLLSLMDHTPGQRQWRDLSKWRLYHRDKNWTDDQAQDLLMQLREMQQQHAATNRSFAVDFARARRLPLASHDDTTHEDVAEAAQEGVSIAEFPTTIDAAEKARQLGMATVMGAPNALRGISHSGNVSASLLAKHELLDGLSSDYVPNSLLHSAFHLHDTLEIELPETVAMISTNIAEMVGLKDRGELTPGKIADMLHVQLVDGLPVIRKVWKRGQLVA